MISRQVVDIGARTCDVKNAYMTSICSVNLRFKIRTPAS
jgi:hypothetical protein